MIYGRGCFYKAETQEKGVIIGILSVLEKRHNIDIKNYFEGTDHISPVAFSWVTLETGHGPSGLYFQEGPTLEVKDMRLARLPQENNEGPHRLPSFGYSHAAGETEAEKGEARTRPAVSKPEFPCPGPGLPTTGSDGRSPG